ncbi:MAG TPA: hypothetical protein VFW11_18560 [Cyclobacteriaceae bacterium]|nr:hypothetical protein [Cyclobacteriaceae bacterium]
MSSEKLTNAVVKSAIDSWQAGDEKQWFSFFTKNAKLFDDGSPRDFYYFSKHAIGRERFTSIDKVENDGKDVYGHFHTDEWGDFKTYFRFHLNAENKIFRLDIGQANY